MLLWGVILIPESMSTITLASRFDGHKTVATLANNSHLIPDVPGVYLVLFKGENQEFLTHGTGGYFKGKDPNVSIQELENNWVSGTEIVYIGKATSLKKRLGQLIKFGNGQAIGHWGGRLLWQLKGSSELVICWLPTPNQVPENVESELIAEFKSIHGKRPFTNLRD